jgi:SDR family mycofactocin-dependent oxidoreductase
VSGPRVAGKVVLITGAARGQGRSHAIRLAEEGADIIGVDVCRDLPALDYPLASPEDLAETARLVEKTGQRMVTAVVDVRDVDSLREAVDAGVEELGRLDVAVANAGVCSVRRWDEVTPDLWDTVISVNLTGVWNTCQAALPHLVTAGGGSLILISSAAGLKAPPFFTPYAAAKHGLVGIMRSLANELASRRVRVNSIHPTGVDTPMLVGTAGLEALLAEDPELGPLFRNALPVEVIAPADVSHAVLYLASDESRSVTGSTLAVDAGISAR